MWVLYEASEGTKTIIQKALAQASEVEKVEMSKLVQALSDHPEGLSDDRIKQILKQATRSFSALLSSELELAALARISRKSSASASSGAT